MKRLVFRVLSHVAGLAVVVLSSLWATAPLAVAGIPAGSVANPASASPCLQWLPSDFVAVGELNWKAMVRFLNSPEARQNPQRAQFDQLMQMTQLLTAIDAERQVDRIALFLTCDQDTGALGYAVAIHGSFDSSAVEYRLRLSVAKAVPEDYNDHCVYCVNDMSFCFPGRSTILIGDARVLRRSLDKFDAVAAPLPKSLRGVLDRTPAESLAWLAVRPSVILAQSESAEWEWTNAPVFQKLREVEALSLAITTSGDGLRAEVLGYVSESDEAKSVHRYLRDERRRLLHLEGANVFIASFLVLSEMDQRGNYVWGSCRLTWEGLQDLWSTKFVVQAETD